MTERERIEELEDAITDAGIILAGGIDEEDPERDPQKAIAEAMRCLGRVMSDPEVLKRQGI